MREEESAVSDVRTMGRKGEPSSPGLRMKDRSEKFDVCIKVAVFLTVCAVLAVFGWVLSKQDVKENETIEELKLLKKEVEEIKE